VQLSNTGKIHGYRDGTTWKYKKETIEDYIKKQRESAKPASDDYGYGDSDEEDQEMPLASSPDAGMLDDDDAGDAVPYQKKGDDAAFGSSDI
ncbi:hypothetical protein ACLJB8_09560, partial [Campylobacter coli]|uniref:hypothetical protein n=1 Tax=Campylobacter coli TaxID=195 RepID=UPI003F7BE4FF